MIFWDPNPDLFTIPVIDWPVKWYGVLFALGFAIGFPLFRDLLFRFFLQNPEFQPNEILDKVDLKSLVLDPNKACQGIGKEAVERFKRQAARSRCLHEERALARLCWEEKLGDRIWSLKKKALKVTDKLTIYVVIATILGARIGHFLFYERPSDYLRDPMELLRIREGGLASHGAAIAILLALWFFTFWSRSIDKRLTWLCLLDLISIPTALGGAFIRLGNFFNQEILGTPTSLPWGVLFGHPMDRSALVPRHPVQIYEALAYFAVFFLLWGLSYKPSQLMARGRLIGLFLVLVFSFRFVIEFFKIEQSHLLEPSMQLSMGQWLSIPFILLGIALLMIRKVFADQKLS